MTHPRRETGVPPSDQLEELVRQYSRLVHAVVRKVGGAAASHLGDDVQQQVFLEIWKQVAKAGRIESPSSYIYRAAVRETVRMLKRERRHEGTDAETIAAGPSAASDADTPQTHAQSRETGARIDEQIEALPPERRKAVRAHLAGFEVREIMELQNWSYHRARNLIARGMADLRRGLKRRGVDA